MNIRVVKFDSIDSTNTEAMRQARLGAEEGLCITAREQTAGRGRHGRTWISGPDAGLYFSILIRPQIEGWKLPLITLMAGVACFDTLVELGVRPDLKWVNDLLVQEKKLGGILAEATDTSLGLAVIVGVGINLTSQNFPPEVAGRATSIHAETGRSITSDDLIPPLIRNLSHFYRVLLHGNDHEIIEHWKSRSSYFSGKRVRVTLGGNTIEGTTAGLERNGALRIRRADGRLTLIQAGDVERLRPRLD